LCGPSRWPHDAVQQRGNTCRSRLICALTDRSASSGA
jgi:hypothetical protein